MWQLNGQARNVRVIVLDRNLLACGTLALQIQ
jgi:hypothetical protein